MLYRQLDMLSLLRPEVSLEEGIIIIGATEHNADFFDDFLRDFSNCKIFALDTETFGEEDWQALYFEYCHVRLLQIGLEDGRVLIIDFGGWLEKDQWANIRADSRVTQTLEVLKQKAFDNDVPILGVNLGGFDFPILRKHFDIIARQARDLMIISQVVWAGVGAYKAQQTALCALSHSLKSIAERLGFEVDKTEQTSDWGWELNNNQINYAAKDVKILFPIFQKLRELVTADNLKFTAWVECRAVAVFANMEYFGFPINPEVAHKLLDKYTEELNHFVSIFQSYYPGVLWSSTDQLLKALRQAGHDVNCVTKEVLQQIGDEPCLAIVSARNRLKKIRSIESILSHAFNNAIHTKYNQIGPAATGRTTSYSKIKGHDIGLQLQNVDKDIREIFQPADPEKYGLGIYDGSGMHQRIATECSKDPKLIAGYTQGLDLHSLFASDLAQILGEDGSWTYEFIKANRKNKENPELAAKCTKYRDLAKKIFYSCLNGSGQNKVLIGMHSLGFNFATSAHSKRAYDVYQKLYPVLLSFIKSRHREASSKAFTFDFKDSRFVSMGMNLRRYGKVRTLTGRIQYIEFEQNRQQISYTKATAALWLMCEADLLKLWMAEVQDKFWETPEWEANIVNMVHDEINFVYNKRYQKEIAEFVVGKMQEIFGKFIKVIPPLEEDMIKNPELGMCTSWNEK